MTAFSGTTEAGCTPRAKVTVGDTELPTVNEAVETYARKGGPADITRESIVEVPIRWGDEDVAEAINGLSGGHPRRQQVSIEMWDPRQESYTPVHRGFVAAAGGHSDTGAARLRVADFAQLLADIPASRTFSDAATIADVMRYVKSTFLDGQEVVDELHISSWGSDDQVATLVEEFEATVTALQGGDVTEVITGALVDTFTPTGSTSFSANEDSLLDILDWVCRLSLHRWYFHPRPPGRTPRLVLERNPTATSFHGHHVDPEADDSTEVTIQRNNALAQINPPHRLRAIGSVESLTEKPLHWLQEGAIDQYPTATVEYGPLADQTDVEQPPIEIGVDAITLDETETLAERELKDRLDRATGGEMRLQMAPELRPFARIEALPVCGSEAVGDLPSISYEAEEVIHYAHSTGSNSDPGMPMTVARVGLYVDEREIEVTSSGYVEG